MTRRAEKLRQEEIKAHAGDVVLVVDDQLVSRRSDQEGEKGISRVSDDPGMTVVAGDRVLLPRVRQPMRDDGALQFVRGLLESQCVRRREELKTDLRENKFKVQARVLQLGQERVPLGAGPLVEGVLCVGCKKCDRAEQSSRDVPKAPLKGRRAFWSDKLCRSVPILGTTPSSGSDMMRFRSASTAASHACVAALVRRGGVTCRR